MIPKVIHYCWFGRSEKPPIVKKCIESWYKHCPDWEIMEWNEENFDVSSVRFMQEAYDTKKYAFASDVARLEIIYIHGGVYLDTDVELLQPIDEKILSTDGFAFFENGIRINTGLGFGAMKENKVVKLILDDYRNKDFIRKNGSLDTRTCPGVNTAVLARNLPTLELNGTTQCIDGFYFYSPTDYSKFAIHHYAGSWGDSPNDHGADLTGYKTTSLKKVLRKPSRQKWVRQNMPPFIHRAFVFVSYDLLELGVWYFVRRLFHKLSKH